MGIKKYLPINDPYSVTVSLVRYDGKNAILHNEQIGEIKWPIALLPENADLGTQLTLKITDEKTKNEEHYTHLRKLLEELIN